MAKPRDYTRDTAYENSPLQIKHREQRNKARRLMIKLHGKSAVAGHDIDHHDGNPMNNKRSNLRITTVHYNRAKH